MRADGDPAEPDDRLYQEGRQWGLDRIRAKALWQEGLRGDATVDVVVIDTGEAWRLQHCRCIGLTAAGHANAVAVSTITGRSRGVEVRWCAFSPPPHLRFNTTAPRGHVLPGLDYSHEDIRGNVGINEGAAPSESTLLIAAGRHRKP